LLATLLRRDVLRQRNSQAPIAAMALFAVILILHSR
jgi:hypothetical protein